MEWRTSYLVRISLVCLLATAPSAFAISSNSEKTESFEGFLKRVGSTAILNGVSQRTVEASFRGLTPDIRVIGFDRKQPEFVQTFPDYITARVTDFRKREGRRLFTLHQALLEEIASVYGVDPQVIVAIWALETSFGRYQGNYSVIRSLATLGYDARRSKFFTRELLKALEILDEQHVSANQFVGAWAGAMGQSQFMPSSFLEYAVDFDGDGRKDIWSTESDVFASIANYLKNAGWKRSEGWGGSVRFENFNLATFKSQSSDQSCRALRKHSQKMPVSSWLEKGVIPDVELIDQPYALIDPEAGLLSGYLVGGNYRAILSYNCANKYAVSVGLMSDLISGFVQ